MRLRINLLRIFHDENIIYIEITITFEYFFLILQAINKMISLFICLINCHGF